MPFEKGKSGNPAGRSKGSRNKRNQELQERITSIVEGEMENVKGGLAQLRENDKKAYIKAIIDLLPFVIPKYGTHPPEDGNDPLDDDPEPDWMTKVREQMYKDDKR